MPRPAPIETNELIHRLRLMAETGGMLTRDRVRTLVQAADRMEDMQERISIMTEHEVPPESVDFNLNDLEGR